MQVGEFFVYLMLTIILIALIGVLMWLVYDYSNLKNILSSNFNIISNKFSSHKTTDNTLDKNIKTNTSNFNDEIENTSNYISSVSSYSSNYVDLIASDSSNYVDLIASDSSNYINNTNNTISTNATEYEKDINTFNDNLDKYFQFGETDSEIKKHFGTAENKKLFDYKMTAAAETNDLYLTLRNETYAASEMTMKEGTTIYTKSGSNSNSGYNIKLCENDSDSSCFKLIKKKSGDQQNNVLEIISPNTSDIIKIGKLTIDDTAIKWNGNPIPLS